MPPIIEPRLLKGFRDIPADHMAIRQHMIATVSQVLERYAFQPLETPALEYADILLGKLGDEGEKLLYTFTDHGQRQVAMRYDLTVPLARHIAQNSQLAKPFKRYQVGPVWRADNPQRGRFREFYQFDADIVGTNSPLSDAEMLVLIQDSLLALNVNQFIIRVNDRQLINRLADQLGLNNQQTKQFFKVLDNLEKVTWDQSAQAFHLIGLSTTDVQQVRHQLIDNPGQLADISPELDHIAKLAIDLGLDTQYLKFDPSIVRGLDYYSGMVFETTLPQAPQYGSVFSGGRYDGLVGRFSKQQLPAIGASIGLDRLMAALEELNQLPHTTHQPQVIVTLFDQSVEAAQATTQAAATLRQAGLNTAMTYQSSSIGKQCKQAAAQNIPWAIIIGPTEQEQHQVTLRSLNDQTEQQLPLQQAILQIRAS